MPVEWQISDGGNGHYYEKYEGGEYASMSWVEAHDFAASLEYNGMSGHLATMTSPAEFYFIDAIKQNGAIGFGVYMGAWKLQAWDPTHADDLGWRWVTGETWDPDSIDHLSGFLPMNDGGGIALQYSCGPAMHDWWCAFGSQDPYGAFPDDGFCIIVEYDDLAVVNPFPLSPVSGESSSWGAIKSAYR